MSPNEVAPWPNIPAAYFELGAYVQAVSACDAALSLLTPSDTDSHAVTHKLSMRKAKSCFFAGLYEDAGAATDSDLFTSAEAETLSKGVSAAKHVEDPMKATHEIVLNLLRYKPTL